VGVLTGRFRRSHHPHMGVLLDEATQTLGEGRIPLSDSCGARL
jgi:hypothetical protein